MMMTFLKKYWLRIIYMGIFVALVFGFIPSQEKLYLETDFNLLEKTSHTLMIWIIVIGSLIILFLALRKVDNIQQVINVLLSISGLALALYFVLKTVILSSFLLLNRINLGNDVDKKYTASFFLESDSRVPMICDIKTARVISCENVNGIEKLQNLKVGDTVIVSFNQGLLGFNFKPNIK